MRRGDARTTLQRNARAFPCVVDAIAIDVLAARMRIASRIVDAVVA